MIGGVLTLLGAVISLLGLIVRVTPGLDRPKRRYMYKHLPITKSLFQLRQSTNKGRTPDKVNDKWIIREFLDHIDNHLTRDTPEKAVVAVTPYAADFRVHFSDGEQDSYGLGRPSHDVFETIVSDAMQSKCQWWGLVTAVIGALITGVGILVSL
ncbi:hypothetical protein [Halolamina pelagica]|uniref:hypothetical protein n=1 Tax=Halolamina pelagica TaxID=699431 RepID=UPI0011874320|nr:hypothetical protein [Halolamina pelagica]